MHSVLRDILGFQDSLLDPTNELFCPEILKIYIVNCYGVILIKNLHI